MLLLDEPLSALDRKLREETRFELMELQKRLGLTFIVVTHDQEEAMTVADRIGVMNSGRLVQVAPPAEVYEQPNSRWVAGFIGDVNLIEGRVTSSGLGHAMIESVAGGRIAVSHAADLAPGTHVWVALRPEKIEIDTKAPVAGAENSFSGRVSEIGYLGGISIYKIMARQRHRDEGRRRQPRPQGRAGRGERPRLAELQARSRRAADPMTDTTTIAPPGGDTGMRSRIGWRQRLVILIPALWLAVLFLVPCLIVLKISLSQTVIAQPPYAPVLDLAAGWQGLKDFVSG